MSSSNCCFLTCTQVSQDKGQVVWCLDLSQDFPQNMCLCSPLSPAQNTCLVICLLTSCPSLSSSESLFWPLQAEVLFPFTWSPTEHTAYTVRSSLLFTHSFVHNFLKLWCTWYWTPLVAQMTKNLPAIQETQIQSWVRKIPWKRESQPTPVFLPGESHGQRSLAGYCPRGCRVGHDWATNTPGTIQSAASFDNYSFVLTLFLQGKCNILL